MSSTRNTGKSEPIAEKSGLRTGWLGAVAAGLIMLPWVAHGDGEISSYALVHDDATLEVAGRHLRLYRIHIPETGRVCEHRIQPARCGSHAARALRFKIQGFVSCRLGGKYDDGSIAAYCRTGDQDLGAYLIRRGWAVALPNAPFAYRVTERIARHQGFGVWGFNVDQIRFAP